MKNFVNNKYFFAENESSGFDAGGKAVSDVIEILKNKGYSPILINSLSLAKKYDNKILGKICKVLVLFELFFKLFKLPNNCEIILNYPTRVNPGRATFWIFSHYKIKKFKFVIIVHDLKDLQKTENEKGGDNSLVNLLKNDKSSIIIVHTNSMKKYLLNLGIENKQINILGVFDYLLPNEKQVQKNKRKKSNEIIIAGNLKEEKMKFLNDVNQLQNLIFNLYGNNLSEKVKKYNNINYFGAFPPEKLINELTGSFGLVWDSDSYKELSGEKGNYQKFNAPHKLSLYLAAGFPVILSDKAGMAEFVVENKIGIVVTGLQEIENEINNLTNEQYEELCNNVDQIAIKIKNGYFLNNILDKIN